MIKYLRNPKDSTKKVPTTGQYSQQSVEIQNKHLEVGSLYIYEKKTQGERNQGINPIHSSPHKQITTKKHKSLGLAVYVFSPSTWRQR